MAFVPDNLIFLSLRGTNAKLTIAARDQPAKAVKFPWNVVSFFFFFFFIAITLQ